MRYLPVIAATAFTLMSTASLAQRIDCQSINQDLEKIDENMTQLYTERTNKLGFTLAERASVSCCCGRCHEKGHGQATCFKKL